MNIAIIQNTRYHFETAIALYLSVLKSGYLPRLVRAFSDADIYNQTEYIVDRGILTDDGSYYNEAIVTTCLVSSKDIIPNSGHDVFRRCGSLTYVIHQIVDPVILPRPLTIDNVYCLTPVGKLLGYKYFSQFEVQRQDAPAICPKVTLVGIQGYLGFGHRSLNVINPLLAAYPGIQTQFLGGGASLVKIPDSATVFSDLPEIDFHEQISKVGFLAPCIDPFSDNCSYATRFSSTFGLALGYEKPVFAHEVFRDLYELPGVYYNSEDIQEKIAEIVNLSESGYAALVGEFALLKARRRTENIRLLSRRFAGSIQNLPAQTYKNATQHIIGRQYPNSTVVRAIDKTTSRLCRLICAPDPVDEDVIDCVAILSELVREKSSIPVERLEIAKCMMQYASDLMKAAGKEVHTAMDSIVYNYASCVHQSHQQGKVKHFQFQTFTIRRITLEIIIACCENAWQGQGDIDLNMDFYDIDSVAHIVQTASNSSELTGGSHMYLLTYNMDMESGLLEVGLQAGRFLGLFKSYLYEHRIGGFDLDGLSDVARNLIPPACRSHNSDNHCIAVGVIGYIAKETLFEESSTMVRSSLAVNHFSFPTTYERSVTGL